MDELDTIIRRALDEDIGPGDITTEATVPERASGAGVFLAKQDLVLSGILVARKVFNAVDSDLEFDIQVDDGSPLRAGQAIARVNGRLGSMLTAERVALNFLMRMSGIATITRAFVKAAGDNGAVVTDTRKTAPGLRLMDRMAVRHGSGKNHRMGLYDAVLIKDNHIRAAGGIVKAIESARDYISHTVKIEVEVSGLEELKEALDANADIIMLDNMGLDDISRAVKMAGGKAIIEASGNVTLDTVGEIADRGVEVISVGRLTHSAPAADISFDITLVEE